MNKGRPSAGGAKEAPGTAANDTDENEPEQPQNGFGKFEYINQTLYIGEWKITRGRKVKHGQGKITFPGATSG